LPGDAVGVKNYTTTIAKCLWLQLARNCRQQGAQITTGYGVEADEKGAKADVIFDVRLMPIYV
jgi:hypothetical protein